MTTAAKKYYKPVYTFSAYQKIKYVPDIESFGTTNVLFDKIKLIISDIKNKKSKYRYDDVKSDYDDIKLDEVRILIIELIKRLPSYNNEKLHVSIRDDVYVDILVYVSDLTYLLIINFDPLTIDSLNNIYRHHIPNFKVFVTSINECLKHNDINSLESFSCLIESMFNDNYIGIGHDISRTLLFKKIVNSKFPEFIDKAAKLWDKRKEPKKDTPNSKQLITKNMKNLHINSYKEIPLEFYSFSKSYGFPLFGEQLTVSGIYKCISKYFHDDLVSMIMNYL